MRQPYEITPGILKYVASISEKIGEVNAKYLNKQTPQLRKENKIKTIHSSLQIEGNTLNEQQITAIIDNKKVAGPEKDILEVINAIEAYDKLSAYSSKSEKSFLSAHKLLMKGLISNPGKYRKQGVGIVKGSKIQHLAPPFENVSYLMKDLFNYIKNNDEITLIKSCVFHYEMEFIHPFMDGNGRMGRLWQTVLLVSDYAVFEFLPFETLISKNQDEYYKALSLSDKQGKSTIFIEYMLGIINESLATLLDYNSHALKDNERLDYFISQGKLIFSRKDYMNLFKELSSATASRDLKKGVENGVLEKTGDKTKTVYKVK
ncbi:MAG TPA: Fic family protein [Hanamia sp.]